MNLTFEEMSEAQRSDEEIGPIFQHLTARTVPTKYEMAGWSKAGQIYGQLFESLRMSSQKVILYKKPEIRWQTPTFVEVILWPQDLISHLIAYAHKIVAHKAVEATMGEIQRIGYFII